jgi:hypothetical protein
VSSHGQRQVFGLTGFVVKKLPTGYRFPFPFNAYNIKEGTVLIVTFVPDYRCGAVPDSHRIPFRQVWNLPVLSLVSGSVIFFATGVKVLVFSIRSFLG